IATELANADNKKAEAQKERDEFQKKNEEFDQQRDELLSEAKDGVKAERQRLLDEARKDSDTLRAKRANALKREQQTLNDEITRRTRKEVFAITRKALTDLAGTSLEERMVDVFVRRLHALNGEEKEWLTSAFKTPPGPMIVRTMFDLLPAQRASTEDAIKETLGKETQVRFETTPDLVSGIELTTNGHKVAWSIADYLASLENAVDELLKENDKPMAKAEPNPEDPKPTKKSP
ncbi:MAG: F0F1 ATP synthase subunit B, partial [Phycisphaerae bacterium]|nr:F0F1 ATP synthase subunit B [Phycisphaerae bacterium]